MSADDGWLLRKDKNEKFVLQHYFASADTLPDINTEFALRFDDVEEALVKFQEMEAKGPFSSEYGLTVYIKEITE